MSRALTVLALTILLLVAAISVELYAHAQQEELNAASTKLKHISWTKKRTHLYLQFEDGSEVTMRWEDGRKVYEAMKELYAKEER